MQIKLCKLHNAKQIIRDKLRKHIKNHQLSQMNGPTRPERAEAPSPGHRPELLWSHIVAPVRAKALKNQAIYKAFALTGRLADCYYTQGDALG